MELEFLNQKFSICKLLDTQFVNWNEKYLYFSKTENEISLVCQTSALPSNALNQEDGYVGFRVKGTLDFALTGVLAPIAQFLAEAYIPIFVVSTYDTDYVFIKEDRLEAAKGILLAKGYIF